jgi:hypothetical protein
MKYITSHQSRLRHRPLSLLLVASVVALTLAGCSLSRQSGLEASDRKALNEAVQNTGVLQFGVTVLDRTYGSRGISSDPPTRAVNLLTTMTETDARQRVSVAFSQVGFEARGADSWGHRSGSRSTTVAVGFLPVGTPIKTSGADAAVPSGKIGIAFVFSTNMD